VQAIAQHVGRDLYTEIGEADIEVRERLLALGFVVNRVRGMCERGDSNPHGCPTGT
jgi:hypothetical protein